MDKWQDLIEIARAAITEGRTVTIKADDVTIVSAPEAPLNITINGLEVTVE